MARKTRVKGNSVLVLLKEGKKVDEIAEILKTDVATVKRHKGFLIKDKKLVTKDMGLQWSFDTLESATDFWIERLKESKRVPELETRVKVLEDNLSTSQKEINHLNELLEEKAKRNHEYEKIRKNGDKEEIKMV